RLRKPVTIHPKRPTQHVARGKSPIRMNDTVSLARQHPEVLDARIGVFFLHGSKQCRMMTSNTRRIRRRRASQRHPSNLVADRFPMREEGVRPLKDAPTL